MPYSRESGTRLWTIVDFFANGNCNEYTFEEIYSNRMTLYYTIDGEVNDTLFPDNDTMYFIINENLDSEDLVYMDYNFNRYSSVRDTVFWFKNQSCTEVKMHLCADACSTRIQYYYGSGNTTMSYTYTLDSCYILWN